MVGIPSTMYSRVRETLIDCGPFESDEQLRSVFAHPKLRPWRHSVPQASNPATRVEATMAFLADKRRADTQENTLVLLLRALSERLDPADECHHRLVGLAGDLEHALGGGSSAGQTSLSTDTASIQPSMADTEIIAEIEELVREDQLAEALVKLSKVVVYRRDATLLTQRLKRTRTQERQGLVTREVANAERTKIAEAILDLISS
jgi:hypothetical protein